MIAANSVNFDELFDAFRVFVDGKVTGQAAVEIS
jgi:hypothetical protein